MKKPVGAAAMAACVAAFAAGAHLAGCSQETVESASKDVSQNVKIVDREVKRAERKARPQLDKLKLGGRVTTALRANQNLPTSIRVDAGEAGVKLRGVVKTEEQRELAGRIARDTLKDEYEITNDLKVAEK